VSYIAGCSDNLASFHKGISLFPGLVDISGRPFGKLRLLCYRAIYSFTAYYNRCFWAAAQLLFQCFYMNFISQRSKSAYFLGGRSESCASCMFANLISQMSRRIGYLGGRSEN
jgi:hypothetical protein